MRDSLQFLHDTNYMWKWGLNKHPGREFSELRYILGLPSLVTFTALDVDNIILLDSVHPGRECLFRRSKNSRKRKLGEWE